MSALLYSIHSKTPELRKIRQVADALRQGAVVLYPTDSGFTLGCELSNKDAISRIRAIRNIPETKEMTFLCRDLTNLSEFARVSTHAYRTIKGLIPGPYTFILPASKMVPKFAQLAKRKTAGIRVPDNILVQLLLKDLGSPIISISAKISNDDVEHSPDAILAAFTKLVDVAVQSDDYHFLGESTLIDMTNEEFLITRRGAGYDRVHEFIETESSEEES
ncbi:MAG: L-threonylcarbamoyladenylate synthase [Candidatus Kapabacteria bacterium]|nr:L-threonylcarbamoyladenylate synthase [Candidatus Kapabacteria bacterium]